MTRAQTAMEEDAQAKAELLFEIKDLKMHLKSLNEIQSDVEVLFTNNDVMMEGIEKAVLVRLCD